MSANIWFDKRFLAYAFGLAIDRLGNAIYMVVAPFLTYKITGSLSDMSAVAMCQASPRIIFGFLAGTVVDRLDKRLVLFTALVFQGACSCVLALLCCGPKFEMSMLYAMSVFISLGFEFSRSAEIALVPSMFSNMRNQAISALATIHSVMFVAGPAIAGFLIHQFDYTLLLVFNMLSSIAPILVSPWSRIPKAGKTSSRAHTASIMQSTIEGFSFIRHTERIRALYYVFAVVVCATGGIQTTIVFHVKNQLMLNDASASVVLSLVGAGMIAGSTFSRAMHKTSVATFFAFTVFLQALGLSLFLVPNIVLAMLGQFLFSCGNFSFLVAIDIHLHEGIPDEMRGRVSSFFRLTTNLTGCLSVPLLATLVNMVGSTAIAFLFAALLTLIGGVYTWRAYRI